MVESVDRYQLLLASLGTIAFVLLAQFCIRFLSLVLKAAKQRKELNAFPGPPTHWLYGNLGEVRDRTKLLERFLQITKEFVKCSQFWIGPFLPTVRLYHPDFVREICRTAEPKARGFYRNLEPWIGEGLLISHGKKWARARKLLTPAFHFDILKPYIKVFTDSTNIMMEKWKSDLGERGSKSASFDMFEYVSLMTLDSILKCAFSYGSKVQNEGKKNPYIKAVYDMSELAVQRPRFFPFSSDLIYYFSYSGYRFRKACAVAHGLSTSVIELRRKTLKEKVYDKPSSRYLDFLDILLTAKDTDGNGLTDQEIQNEVDTFLFEGHDTTASGISWCLYNLARHPEYQDRCREEVNRVMADRDTLTWENMSEFEFLTMCIKESMRLYPPVPGISRQLTKPLVLPDNRSLPKDMNVSISIYGVHHSDDVWQDPEVYDPYRFSALNSKGRSPHAFIPFSAGPRNCIGQNFAMNEMRTAVALVLRNFTLKVDESKKVLQLPELILRADGGLWVEVSPIEKK